MKNIKLTTMVIIALCVIQIATIGFVVVVNAENKIQKDLLKGLVANQEKQVDFDEAIQKNVESLTDKLSKSINLIDVITHAIGDDYPPKKKLGERSWCLNRSCLDL